MKDLEIIRFVMNYSKFIDLDYVYKGIYLTRLISYLFFLYSAMIIYTHYTGENILTTIIITTGFLIFIMICGYIGDLLKWKSIW